MKKEEVSYLDVVKHSKGLDDITSNDEIRNFIDTQKGFRLLKKECKKKDTLIKNLENKIRILTDKLKKSIRKQSKVLKQSKNKIILNKNSKLGKDIFEETISKSEEKKIKMLVNRIKHNMGYKEYTRSDIKIELMIPQKLLDKCINRLKNDDFIGSRIVSGHMRYYKK